MNKIKSKALFLAIIGLSATFFSNDFGVIDIEKTAIIVALGIDIDESEGYIVSTQIATPDPASEANVLNDQTTIEGKGKTIAQAVDNVGKNTGWYPLLTYCQLLILGVKVLDTDIMDILGVFVRTDKVPSSALVAICEGKAKEVLSATSPLDSVSSFAIEKILVKQIAKTDCVAMVNVKDFACGYYGISGFSYAPSIKTVDTDAKNTAGGESEKSQTTSLFDVTQTCYFDKGMSKGKLNPSQTLIFNILGKKTLEAYLTLENIEIFGQKADATFNIENFSSNKKVIADENGLTLDISLNATLALRDANKTGDLKSLSAIVDIPDAVLNAAELELKEIIQSIFIKTQEEKCDVFKIGETLFKFDYNNYEKFKDKIFNSKLNLTIKCNSVKK